ncbi:MAG: hypothetical protein A2Y41_06075 [Spirochaetes bacterium GWB1_36_13]|nr:MAG: hypothetical protein A2Y41_06075 [Spirochaetes bacterium GWB1_36_13]
MKTLPLPIHQRIDFKGYIQNHDLIRLYQEAKLFTAPSFHEGFGLIILEAMAAGSPVLTSPRGAIPEYFKDAVVFCDPERHEDIAEKMLSILQNEEVQKDLVLHGNRLVQNFTLENMARGYVEAFEKLKNP